MAISLKTAKMLWGRAAGRCSMPECRQPLVIDSTETDNEALIGDMCHIVAETDLPPDRFPEQCAAREFERL